MNLKKAAFVLLAAASVSGGALGQTQISATLATPALDRWMYPFNFSAGAEATAPVFAALDQPDFDDRDSQFIVGWSTQGDIETGLPLQSYVVSSAVIRVVISSGDRWQYDPTVDPTASYLPTSDAAFIPDTDAGRPVELFAVGYRNGFSAATFGETSPFTLGSPFPPREAARNAFAATVSVDGSTSDVSNQVRDRADALPFATGLAALTPGQVAPADTELSFSIDVSSLATRAYLARGLATGNLRFAITSLSPASGGPGGGTGDATYPAFYTKENALSPVLGFSPSLALVVTLRPPADADLDGDVDSDDIIVFFAAWDSGEELADFDLDGDTDSDDIVGFFTAWDNG